MSTGDYIAIISIVVPAIISIIGGVYAVVKSTKKFELADSYRKEILEWYSNTIIIMTTIISKVKKEDDRTAELSSLSAQIEIGRFYFPNINKNDGYGKYKPVAYQGYRMIVLDFLVYFYDTAKKPDAKMYKSALWEFLRLYTSAVFDIISPKDRINKIKKYSDFVMNEEVSLNDFLTDEANFKRFYQDKT